MMTLSLDINLILVLARTTNNVCCVTNPSVVSINIIETYKTAVNQN